MPRPSCPGCGSPLYDVEDVDPARGVQALVCRECDQAWEAPLPGDPEEDPEDAWWPTGDDKWDENVHINLAPEHKRAQVLQCPNCGKMEVWHHAEIRDHGYCRSQRDVPCVKCGHEPTTPQRPCPECGRELPKQAATCSTCGYTPQRSFL